MPYGIPKAHGGDSPENIARMKDCMAAHSEKNPGVSEESCIRICKASLFGKRSPVKKKKRKVPQRGDI